MKIDHFYRSQLGPTKGKIHVTPIIVSGKLITLTSLELSRKYHESQNLEINMLTTPNNG